MHRKANHVIQSGPNTGKTVGEVRRLKRAARGGRQQQAVVQGLPQRIPRRRRPRGVVQLQGSKTQTGAIATLEAMVSEMAGASLKPKEATAFFNRIPGLSQEGRRYLLALTHPNNEELRSFQGIPDSMPDEFNPYVTIDDSTIISWDPSLFAETPPDTVNSYNILVMFPPIPEIECLYVLQYRLGSGALQDSRINVIRSPGFNKETDTTLASPTTVRVFNTFKDMGYASHRRAGSGRTIIPIASGLNNQGNIVAGQLPDLIGWSDVEGVFAQKGGAVGITDSGVSGQIDPTEEYTVFKHASLILPNVSDLTQLDKKCLDIPFKEGAYIPMVPSEPIDTLKKRVSVFSGESHTTLAKDKDGSTVPGYFFAAPNSFLTVHHRGTNGLLNAVNFSHGVSFTKNTGSYGVLTPLMNMVGNEEIIADGFHLHPSISEPADFLTGFAFISGLNVSAGSGVPTASIKIRATDYNELYPLSTEPAVAVYRMPHILRDENALRIATHVTQIMAHALPGCDNAFNGVLGKIWDVVKNVIRPMAGAAKFLPIPYAGAIGDIVREGVDFVDNIGNAGMI